MKFEHPFVAKKVGWLTYLKNGYVADRRIFLAASFVVILLGVYGWSVDNFAVEHHVYLHCPDDAIGGTCDNPLYQTCKEEYCQSKTLFAGYTYGEPPKSWTTGQNISVVLMFLVVVAAIVLNHYKYNEDFHVDLGE